MQSAAIIGPAGSIGTPIPSAANAAGGTTAEALLSTAAPTFDQQLTQAVTGNTADPRLPNQAPDARQAPDTNSRYLRELEALFISLMLKNFRQSESGDGLFPGDKSDTLGGMFDMYLGEHLAAAGGIGLTDILAASQAFRQERVPQQNDFSHLHALAVQAYSSPIGQ